MIRSVSQQPAFSLAVEKRLLFEEATHTETRRLFSVANSILRDHDEAEDAVQETMFRAWRSWNQLRDPEKRRAWLTRICVNHCVRRREKLLQRWLQLPEHHEETAAITMDSADPDLDRAFRKLSTRQRAVVTLHYQFGYSLDECATILQSRPGTVRSHLNRALTTLRKEIGDV